MAAVDIGKYAEGYLQEWDQRATVRARQRYRLTADALSKELYPALLMPILKHPEVVALGEEARRRIAVQTAREYSRYARCLGVTKTACGQRRSASAQLMAE